MTASPGPADHWGERLLLTPPKTIVVRKTEPGRTDAGRAGDLAAVAEAEGDYYAGDAPIAVPTY